MKKHHSLSSNLNPYYAWQNVCFTKTSFTINIFIMKTILYTNLIFILLLSGCISSKRQIQKGNYDIAIKNSVKKLHKKPHKEKEIINLDKAYKFAMQRDNERINFLRKSGQPDIWEEIFLLYEKMKRRQELVRVLPVNVLNAIGFKMQDFDNDIIEAKKKAAEFMYAHAQKLLENKDKTSARLAYEQLIKVKSYFSTYRDVDAMMQKALLTGTTYVLFTLRNNSGIPLPSSFETELKKISLTDLNAKWVRYETQKIDNRNYDYIILLNIRIIDVGPDGLKEIHYTESKEVADGFQYVLDANGNVMKDSLGNDIKIPKTKIISCNVIETQQQKAVTLSGTIDFIDLSNTQTICTDPITSQFFFNHVSAIAQGNLDALKPETIEKTKLRPLPFPNDFEMILRAGDIIKEMSKNIISHNRNIIY